VGDPDFGVGWPEAGIPEPFVESDGVLARVKDDLLESAIQELALEMSYELPAHTASLPWLVDGHLEQASIGVGLGSEEDTTDDESLVQRDEVEAFRLEVENLAASGHVERLSENSEAQVELL